MAMNTARDRYKELFNVFASFLYFLNEYVFIEDKERKQQLKLTLWPAQAKIINSMIDELLLVILKARQLGLTWLTAAYVLWRSIKHPLHLTVIISVNEDLSIEFLNRVYFILDRLPEYLYPTIKTRTKQILEFVDADGLVSTIKSMPTTEMGAQSKTPNILIMDETCMNRMASSIFNSSLPGIEAAKGQVIIISNSIKTGPGWGWTRDLYTASMRGLNGFKRIFLAWDAHPGRPKDFRKRMIQSGMDEQDVSEHYPETEVEALQATTGGYFGKTLLKHPLENTIQGWKGVIIKNKMKEYEFEQDKHGIGELWRVPYNIEPKYDGLPWLRRYCVGSDVSEGLGLSYSVAYVMDRLLDEFVYRLRSNRVDAYEWSRLLYSLSCYYDRALLCVERTGAGQTVVKELLKLGAPQYQRLIPGTTSKTQVGVDVGWAESEQSKNDMSEDLRNWYGTTKGTIYCPILLDESATWISHEGTRRIGPEEGKLGDCVVAAGMTIEASIFLGSSPEKTVAPVTGWLGRVHKEYDRGRARVM
jgi:hypothetical protein